MCAFSMKLTVRLSAYEEEGLMKEVPDFPVYLHAQVFL